MQLLITWSPVKPRVTYGGVCSIVVHDIAISVRCVTVEVQAINTYIFYIYSETGHGTMYPQARALYYYSRIRVGGGGVAPPYSV